MNESRKVLARTEARQKTNRKYQIDAIEDKAFIFDVLPSFPAICIRKTDSMSFNPELFQ